jgi:ABC-type multidrug transport system ATPase subunit
MTGNVIELDGLVKDYGPSVRSTVSTSRSTGARSSASSARTGPGKSTTIRILLDLLRPDGGNGRVLGEDPHAAGPRCAHASGTCPVSSRSRARRPHASSSVTSPRSGWAAGRSASTCSPSASGSTSTGPSGPSRRATSRRSASVQALMHRPELALLDEPTSGLDPLLQQEFLTLLREERDAGTSVFLSSHVLSEIEGVADRVALVRDGRIVVVDDVARLRAAAGQRLDVTFEQRRAADALDDHRGAVVEGRRARGVWRGDTATAARDARGPARRPPRAARPRPGGARHRRLPHLPPTGRRSRRRTASTLRGVLVEVRWQLVPQAALPPRLGVRARGGRRHLHPVLPGDGWTGAAGDRRHAARGADRALGYDRIGTPEGYLTSTVFGLLGPACSLVFAVGLGARTVAGEEEDGLLELAASAPVRRDVLLAGRIIAMHTQVAVLALVTFGVTVVLSSVIDLGVPAARIAAASLGLNLLGIAFATVTLAAGAVSGRRAVAVAVGSGVAVTSFVANALSGVVARGDLLERLSPFSWYLAGDPVAQGVPLGGYGSACYVRRCSAFRSGRRLTRRVGRAHRPSGRCGCRRPPLATDVRPSFARLRPIREVGHASALRRPSRAVLLLVGLAVGIGLAVVLGGTKAEAADAPPTCAAGTFLVGDECVPAPPGSFVPDSGAIAAILCPPGRFQDEAGQTACKVAPAGTAVAASGAVDTDALCCRALPEPDAAGVVPLDPPRVRRDGWSAGRDAVDRDRTVRRRDLPG